VYGSDVTSSVPASWRPRSQHHEFALELRSVGALASLGRWLRRMLPLWLVRLFEKHGVYIIAAEIALLLNLFAFGPAASPVIRLVALVVSALVLLAARILADHIEQADRPRAARHALLTIEASVIRVLDSALLQSAGTDVSAPWARRATLRSLVASIKLSAFTHEWEAIALELTPRGRDLCRTMEAFEASFNASVGTHADCALARHISIFRDAIRCVGGSALVLWTFENGVAQYGVLTSRGPVRSFAEAHERLRADIESVERVGDALVVRVTNMARAIHL